jgi:hypothetical protein
MFAACDFPDNLCSQLEDRLVKTGLFNQVVHITPLPIYHSGEAGELLW